MDRKIELKGGPYDGKLTAYSGDEPAQGDELLLMTESRKQWAHYGYDVAQDKYVFQTLFAPHDARDLFLTECKGK